MGGWLLASETPYLSYGAPVFVDLSERLPGSCLLAYYSLVFGDLTAHGRPNESPPCHARTRAHVHRAPPVPSDVSEPAPTAQRREETSPGGKGAHLASALRRARSTCIINAGASSAVPLRMFCPSLRGSVHRTASVHHAPRFCPADANACSLESASGSPGHVAVHTSSSSSPKSDTTSTPPTDSPSLSPNPTRRALSASRPCAYAYGWRIHLATTPLLSSLRALSLA
ncbi:hypothetical protein C8Q76DRAFT_145687 [Earliella scabrosa]|nr:hypothetical protein C8Q76DRAFT_145687 [Earliella scabrosa]